MPINVNYFSSKTPSTSSAIMEQKSHYFTVSGRKRLILCEFFKIHETAKKLLT